LDEKKWDCVFMTCFGPRDVEEVSSCAVVTRAVWCGVIVAVARKFVADDQTTIFCAHYNIVYAYYNIIIVKYY